MTMPTTQTERQPLAEALANLVPLIHQKFVRQISFPVPPTHFFTLVRLYDHGAQTITELSKYLQISKQQMSPVIEKLFRSGCVERQQDPGDRRNTQISITETGYQLLEAHHVKLTSLLCAKLDQLTDAEIAEFHWTTKNFHKLFNKLR